jgi:hypothetical protein
VAARGDARGNTYVALALRTPCPNLQLLGQAIDGGFYYIDIGAVKMTVPEHLAVITVASDQIPPPSVVVSAELIRHEFS